MVLVFLEQDESMWPINRIQIHESANEERKNDSCKRERSKVGRAESIGIKVTKERTMTTMEAITVQSWCLQPTLISSWKRLTWVRAWVNHFIRDCKAQSLVGEEQRINVSRFPYLPSAPSTFLGILFCLPPFFC